MSMGVDKAPGEFAEQMTVPDGWPTLDETALRTRAKEFLEMRDQVHAVIRAWEQQQSTTFVRGVWSGSSADAAANVIARNISAMVALRDHLGKSHAYYNLLARQVAQT